MPESNFGKWWDAMHDAPPGLEENGWHTFGLTLETTDRFRKSEFRATECRSFRSCALQKAIRDVRSCSFSII